jgi:hypothetical protein
MTKREAMMDPESPWNRTDDDEPVFVICGRDVTAWATIFFWMGEALKVGVRETKLDSALRVACAVKGWQAEHGSKVPD